MDTARPLVAIGLPTYNRPAGLRKCLSTIVAQTYPHLDIIISDNCSDNPEVQQVIHEFAGRDKRIRSFRQQENIGLENNFNFVFDQANAGLFTWMSDDDYFDANYIEKCVEFLQSHPDFVLCSGQADYYRGNERVLVENMFMVDSGTVSGRLFKYFSKVDKNGNFYGVFKKEMIEGKPLGIHVGCDWSMLGRLAVAGKLGYTDQTSYHRSIEGNSATRKRMVRKFRLNHFQSIFFETYVAYVVTANIFRQQDVRKRLSFIPRQLFAIMIFFQINWRLFFKFVKKIFGRVAPTGQ